MKRLLFTVFVAMLAMAQNPELIISWVNWSSTSLLRTIADPPTSTIPVHVAVWIYNPSPTAADFYNLAVAYHDQQGQPRSAILAGPGTGVDTELILKVDASIVDSVVPVPPSASAARARKEGR